MFRFKKASLFLAMILQMNSPLKYSQISSSSLIAVMDGGSSILAIATQAIVTNLRDSTLRKKAVQNQKILIVISLEFGVNDGL